MRKLIAFYITTFLISFIAIFFFMFSFMNVFHEFELISSNVLLYLPLIISAILSIVFLIVTIFLMRSEKKTKIGHWFSINLSKIVLAYIFLQLFFVSIRSDVFLSKEDIKGLLSLEWVILGISVTVFLVWNVIMMEYLQNKKPANVQNILPTKKCIYIQNKESFYSDATLLLNNSYLLLVNLIALCIATTFMYLRSKEVTVFSQSITIFVLFLCTNTIIGLTMDILKPFNEKKKALLQETKTTISDVQLQNEIHEQTNEVLIAIDKIDGLKSIDDEEKSKLKTEILIEYIKKYNPDLNNPNQEDTSELVALEDTNI